MTTIFDIMRLQFDGIRKINPDTYDPTIDCIYPHWLQLPRNHAAYRAGLMDGQRYGFPASYYDFSTMQRIVYMVGFRNGHFWHKTNSLPIGEMLCK